MVNYFKKIYNLLSTKITPVSALNSLIQDASQNAEYEYNVLDVQSRGGKDTLLMFAVKRMKPLCIIRLLITAENCKMKNKSGETPATMALKAGYRSSKLKKILQEVKVKGGDLNAANQDGFTPATLALLSKRYDVMEFLETIDIDIWDPTVPGNKTMLYAACEEKAYDAIDFLAAFVQVSHIVNYRVGPKGETALHVATRMRNLVMVKKLLEIPGIRPQQRNVDGYSSLHLVILDESSSLKMLRALVSSTPLNLVTVTPPPTNCPTLQNLVVEEGELTPVGLLLWRSQFTRRDVEKLNVLLHGGWGQIDTMNHPRVINTVKIICNHLMRDQINLNLHAMLGALVLDAKFPYDPIDLTLEACKCGCMAILSVIVQDPDADKTHASLLLDLPSDMFTLDILRIIPKFAFTLEVNDDPLSHRQYRKFSRILCRLDETEVLLANRRKLRQYEQMLLQQTMQPVGSLPRLPTL